jgi:transcriptional regulator with XRE-family HTH domain
MTSRLSLPRENPDAVIIGQNIKRLRTQRGLTQVDLAKKLGASGQSTVWNYEQGWSCPSIQVLKKLSEIFGVTIDALVMDEDSSSDVITDKALLDCFRKAEKLDYRSRFIVQEFVEGQVAKATLEEERRKATG